MPGAGSARRGRVGGEGGCRPDCEAFAFTDLEVERVAFDGLTVSVASPRTLYRVKRDTVRLKHKAAAEMLRRQFDVGEWGTAPRRYVSRRVLTSAGRSTS